jgi:predicted trehalose synthase
VTERIDPAVFVAAERYAINRWLTGMSETVAAAIEAHADLIRRDAGCAGAIVDDVHHLLRQTEPDSSFGTREEWEANRARWARVAKALGGT